MNMLLLNLLLIVQENGSPAYESSPTGTEWMVLASVLVPAAFLAALAYLGHRSSV